uniref:Reverse transcriptase Ty1/copia-type domain-containing protein n=1 Tax=Cannabis sativa TaxID=3483 RepID=A0A803QQB9_CANSA
MFTHAVTCNWDIQQVGINNAFLNGELHETIYMQQPKGFVDPQYPTFANYKKPLSDNSLFSSNKNGKFLLILIYVDDMLITGEDTAAVSHLISSLNSQFALKTMGSGSKKQTTVARSSTESEYRSLSSIATEVVWISSVLKELGITQPWKCWTEQCTTSTSEKATSVTVALHAGLPDSHDHTRQTDAHVGARVAVPKGSGIIERNKGSFVNAEAAVLLLRRGVRTTSANTAPSPSVAASAASPSPCEETGALTRRTAAGFGSVSADLISNTRGRSRTMFVPLD